MPIATLVGHAQEALLLALLVSLPFAAVAALAGLLVAALQAASQIQDPTLAHLPRLLAVIAALAAIGPWAGHQVAAYAERLLLSLH